MKKPGIIRIGAGAGFAGDRLDPALHLMKHADLDYIVFECLAERTIALAQLEKQKDPGKGYNSLLEYRAREVLPLAREHGIRVITNMGAANPKGAGELVAGVGKSLGLTGMRVATVHGDDIVNNINQYLDRPILENGKPLDSIRDGIISANVYLGAGPIVEALANHADIVITGRVADPSLFLAPLMHEFGWTESDCHRLGKGTLVGHLLECAGQVSGGYFADSGRKQVPELWDLGFPFADVNGQGEGVISKVPGTGGLVSTATCTEQLLYEIHDPARYLTPDCQADFSGVSFIQEGKDRVSFTGATGQSPTDTYKVSVGYSNGYLGESEISYGGSDCVKRARMAGDIIIRRVEALSLPIEELRIEQIGVDAINPLPVNQNTGAPEVRLRVVARTRTPEAARLVVNEVEALYTNGPAGGGGVSRQVTELVSIASILVPRSDIRHNISYQDI